jgi:hypothetical protein
MGCHSTPLYSHLHLTKHIGSLYITVPIDAWYLDCSPRCRSDPLVLCESDQFTRNSFKFITENYEYNAEHMHRLCSVENVCINKALDESGAILKSAPDFIAIFEQDANRPGSKGMKDVRVKDILKSMGLEEAERIKHVMKGISISRPDSHNNYENDQDEILRLPRLGLSIKFHFEHMLLFRKFH